MKKKQIVLIVDDNLNFVDRMVGLLNEVPTIDCIYTASEYDEARRVFNREHPDFVLLDINLPGKNGIEILKFIKQSNNACEVVMITNHADDYYRQQCFEHGARYFLDKSNDFAMVPGIISEHSIRN